MPLVAIVPFIRAVANSQTRAASTNRSNVVTRRATQCRAVKHQHNTVSTQNTTHNDGANKNKTKALQTNNLHSRSVVIIAATDRGSTVFVRQAAHWSPSCHSFVPRVRATRVGRQQTAAATEQQQGKNTTNKQLTIQKRCSYSRRRPWHNCICSSRRPLASCRSFVPFVPHVRATRVAR